MLTSSARARLAVVLVGARNPSNIGAAARAMQDFGFSDLRVVNDYAVPFEAAQLEAAPLQAAPLEAAPLQAAPLQAAPLQAAPLQAKSAVGAAHVMHRAQRFGSLADAIADCTFIVGTTAVGDREITQPILPLQQATQQILDGLQVSIAPSAAVALPNPPFAVETPVGPKSSSRVALLFGSEKTGLTNDQLSHCGLLITIPLFQPEATRHLSMNLGQAVAVCLYELTRTGFEGAKPMPLQHEAAATAADRERLTQLLLDALHATGYTRRFPSNSSEPIVRQLARQLGTSHREAMTWMGILRQILWRERGDARE